MTVFLVNSYLCATGCLVDSWQRFSTLEEAQRFVDSQPKGGWSPELRIYKAEQL